VPVIEPGMIKAYELPSIWLQRANITSFISVACETRVCQVAFYRQARMFLTDNMVNLASKKRVFLVQ